MALIILSAFGACTTPQISYKESEKRLTALIDDGIAAGFGTRQRPSKPEPFQNVCPLNRFETKEGELAVYLYEFPIVLLGDESGSFLESVAAHWKSSGFDLEPDDSQPNISGSYASSRDGFHLHVFINQASGLAIVEGTGPCTRKAI